jgi:hypothetical protein
MPRRYNKAGRTGLPILDLGTRSVVSFTPGPLLSLVKDIFWPYLSGSFSTKYQKYGCLCKLHENVFSKAPH